MVSIIIGNYNYGRFLRAAVDSALQQRDCDCEVIVVDDGSTDDSRAILSSYGARITAIVKANEGMASTYNVGFARSTGTAIIFLDADDVLLPGAAAAAREALTPGTAKVHWPLEQIDRDGRRTSTLVPGRPLEHGDLLPALIAEGPDAYLSPPTSGNAWARHLLEHVLPMPQPEFRQHADMFLATLAPVYGRIGAIAEPLAQYRVHGGNDYAGRPLHERNRRNLLVYQHRCQALAEHLRRLGTVVDVSQWERPGTPYAWMRDVAAATDAIAKHIPTGTDFILVDGGALDDGTGLLPGRRTIPFLERGGQYFGPPADDQTAIRELERLQSGGVRHLVFAWPAFWWLEHYAAFHAYLRDRFHCLHEDQRLVIFEMEPGGSRLSALGSQPKAES
jgi:hypothetical protein